jgi:antitoxin component YwqK of YwqJK toxin-antitoxin module
VYSLYFDNQYSFGWDGGCSNGFINGTGILNISNEDSKTIVELSGRFNNGIPEGDFLIHFPISEKKFECNFVNGRQIGKGKFKSGYGDEYVGDLVDLNLHGSGIMKYSKGTVFEGDFKMGKYYSGIYINLKNDTTYLIKNKPVDKENYHKLKKTNLKYMPPLNEELTEYFDSSFVRCNKSNAVFYRKITYKYDRVPNGPVKDYFISNSTLWRKINLLYVDYEDEDLSYYNAGVLEMFHSNGALKSQFYVNYQGKIFGKAKTFYENGKINEILNYNNQGELTGNYASFEKQGNLSSYCFYAQGKPLNEIYYEIDKDGYWIKHYNEDFIQNIKDWEIQDITVQSYDENLFVCELSDKRYFKTKEIPCDPSTQFRLSCSFRTLKSAFKKKSTIGLIFDFQDFYNYSELIIDGNNYAYIVKFSSNNPPEIIMKKKLIKEKSNGRFIEKNIWIQFYFDDIKFYCNNQLIHQMQKWNWIGGKEYGVDASKINGCFEVTSFKIEEFFDPETSVNWTKWVENKVLNDNPTDFDASGTGFFISQDGHLVTNFHVVEDAKSIEVEFNLGGDKVSLPAKVVVKDKTTDLVILKVDAKEFKINDVIPYNLNFQIMDVGSEVFTLGYPMIDVMGSEIKFTDGKISSKSGIEGDIRTYQITTPIQPGNSGGPLFNENGEIIGIIVSTINRDYYNTENVGFALKMSLLKNLIDSSPEEINTIKSNSSINLKLSEKIKAYQNFIPIIKVKQ